jgi:hypothetical protein
MTEKKKVPKGGRLGGTQFPRLSIGEAKSFAIKLVSKTHTGAQPANVILPGVFNNKGSVGGIRASALKQYGLLSGNPKGYSATQLAKDIAASPDIEVRQVLANAFFKARVFKTLFDTFQNDTVTRAKIKQQVQNLKVHPDSSEDCTKIFIESLVALELAKTEGDSIEVLSAAGTAIQEVPEGELSDSEIDADDDTSATEEPSETADDEEEEIEHKKSTRRSASAFVKVNINLDSTMDTDKLERQLKLLKKYGAI